MLIGRENDIIFDMNWKTFGHIDTKNILEKQLQLGLLPHAYLFSGPSGIGKKALAQELAQKILCTERLDSHPDFFILDQSEVISVEQIREVISRLSLKPLAGPKKVAIINNAELLNQQSGNALLKTLEEPSGSTIIILVGDSQRILPTLRSRCLVLNMQMFSRQQLKDFALSGNLEVNEELVDLSFGSPAEFLKLSSGKTLAEASRQEQQRWQELKKLPLGERILAIADLAEMENEQLSNLLTAWLLGQRQDLAGNPKSFGSLGALQEAVVALRSNQNKKSILQSLMLKV